MKKTGVLLIVTAVMLVLSACTNTSYSKANDKVSSMTDYTMEISTVVTINDNSGVKQSAIDQIVSVADKGKSSMLYNVQTTATSTDMATGEVVSEENSYMFYENSYYYTYPGVRYKSATDFEMALSNIENLSNVITFTEDEMLDIQWESIDGMDIATYKVDYEDTSPFVKSVLENAASAFEGVVFAPDSISASSTINDGVVSARDLYIRYQAQTGESILVEIYADYKDGEKIDIPDESKYANIMAQ